MKRMSNVRLFPEQVHKTCLPTESRRAMFLPWVTTGTTAATVESGVPYPLKTSKVEHFLNTGRGTAMLTGFTSYEYRA